MESNFKIKINVKFQNLYRPQKLD